MSPLAFVCLRRTWVFAVGFFLLSTAGVGNDASRPLSAQPVGNHRNVRTELLPSFEPNLGQADPRVKFLSRGRGYTLFLTKDEAVLVVQKPEVRSQKPGVRSQESEVRMANVGGAVTPDDPKPKEPEEEGRPLSVVRGQLQENPASAPPPSFLDLKLLGANPAAKVTGANELPGKSNYLIGNHPKKWRTNVPTYGRARYENIYPGVDLVYYGKPGGQLEYDFIVAPGADPRAITLAIQSKIQN